MSLLQLPRQQIHMVELYLAFFIKPSQYMYHFNAVSIVSACVNEDIITITSIVLLCQGL